MLFLKALNCIFDTKEGQIEWTAFAIQYLYKIYIYSQQNFRNIAMLYSKMPYLWNAKLTYIQIFVPICKYSDLGTNHLYQSSNHLLQASNHLHLGTNDLKIGINDLYLGSNDLYLSSNTTIYN